MEYTAEHDIDPGDIVFTAGDPDGTGPLNWDMSNVDSGGEVFEAQFSTVVTPGLDVAVGDIEGNLMKVAFENTDDERFALRDQADFAYSEAVLDLVKGVASVNAGPTNPPNTDGVTVQGGNSVTYRIDVTQLRRRRRAGRRGLGPAARRPRPART